MLFRWFWPLAWAWPPARSRPKTLLPKVPLKAPWKPLKVPKLLLKALWKLLKAQLPPLAMLPLVPWKQPAKPLLLLATLLPLLVQPQKARWKQPSKFSNLFLVRGRHPQGWRPFPFVHFAIGGGSANRVPMMRATPACLFLALAACGSNADAPGAGGMTVGENARLESAADRLENRAASPAQPAAAQLEGEVAERIAAEQQDAAQAQ